MTIRNLNSSNLTGETATSFSNLKAMQSLDLSYNDLTGPLPEFLSELPNLNTINVSGNNLTGSVPEALLQKFRDGKLALRFQSSGNFNKKSDVYSFGIILFELIAGRIAIVRGLVKNNHILDWVNPLIERGDVQNIIDPRLEGEFDSTSTWKAIEIAMSCIPSYAIQRLDMSYVLAEPKECLALEMAHERTQRMATEGNLTTSSIPYKMTHLKYESDIVPQSR
nr:receptor-like protein kinase [Quercus suber]